MEKKSDTKSLIVLFIVVTYVISAVGYCIWGYFKQDVAAIIPISAIPIATFVIFIKSKKTVRVPFGSCSLRDALIVIIIPIIYFTVPYIVYCVFKGEIVKLNFNISGVFSLAIVLIINGIFEEVGWRGVLLPLMKKVYSLKKSAVIIGIIWSIWHYPMILLGFLYADLSLFNGIILFTFEVILLSAMMAILQVNLKRNSIWPMVLFHISNNAVIEVINNSMGAKEKVFIGDTGYLTIASILICTIVIWYASKRKDLTLNKE